MFDRNLTHLAAKARELEVTVHIDRAHWQTFVGYASGLDERYLQLCLSGDQTFAQINREYIVTLLETGGSLEDLARSEPRDARRIQDKIMAFQRAAMYRVDRR